MERTVILFGLIAVVLLNFMAVTSGIPLPDDGYPVEDVDQAIRMMFDEPMKRGMCRPGYTFQYITRTCVPSLGALRGRTGRRRY